MIRHASHTISTLGLVLLCTALFLFCGRDDEPSGPGGESGTVTLIVASDPDSAEIFIDNASTGIRTPDTLTTSAGNHTVRFELCDYDDRSIDFQGSDGDTVNFNVKLNLTFEFTDRFENGAGNWTAGCPINFADSSSHDGSNFIILSNDGDCSTQLIPSFELPTCGSPSVSFWYRLPDPVTAELRIDAEAGSHYERLEDQKQTWTRVDIPTADLEALVGTATFTFAFSPAGNDTFRFSLDNFSIGVD